MNDNQTINFTDDMLKQISEIDNLLLEGIVITLFKKGVINEVEVKESIDFLLKEYHRISDETIKTYMERNEERRFSMYNIKHIKSKGVHFIWYTKRNGKKSAIHLECQSPIWIKPRLEINTLGWRAGWLWFAIGHCNEPV